MANENYDYSDIERQLKERASQKGLAYDPSDLEDIKRNTGYDVGGISPEQALQNAFTKYDERAATGQSGGGVAGQWTASATTSTTPGWDEMFKALQNRVDSANTANRARNDQLWQTYMDRAQQGLNVDRNSPVIRTQADAYSANEQRASRDYLADLAEKSGPLANLRGEQRLASERLGQRTGTFEAELISRELGAKREEIAQALQGLSGLLSADQVQALQRELAMYDNALRQQGLSIQSQGQNLDWQRALLQNDQFLADLGLRAEDRASYWDAVRSGGLT